jgi:hypothetical protein
VRNAEQEQGRVQCEGDVMPQGQSHTTGQASPDHAGTYLVRQPGDDRRRLQGAK